MANKNQRFHDTSPSPSHLTTNGCRGVRPFLRAIALVLLFLRALNELEVFDELHTYTTTSCGDELHSKAGHLGEKRSFGKIVLLSSVGYGACRRWPVTFALLGKVSAVPVSQCPGPVPNKTCACSNAVAIWVGGSHLC